MKNGMILTAALLVGAGFVAYAFMFQVRFDEVAIRTTFDEIKEDSVIRKAGAQYRWPAPIQSVQKYSTQIQLLEDELRDLQTKDNQVLTLRTYLMWRIDNPADFYVNLRDMNIARSRLKDLLAEGVKNVFTQYTFDQLVNEDVTKIKLEEIEEKSLARIRDLVKQSKYGITLQQVGIKKLVLPMNSTPQVFKRMIAVRETMAADSKEQGESQAKEIRQAAVKAQSNIVNFASNRAAAIRLKGQMDALHHSKAFAQNEELAIFQRRMETFMNAKWDGSVIILEAEGLIKGATTSKKEKPVKTESDISAQNPNP
jgi:membrane protease subunit HflC